MKAAKFYAEEMDDGKWQINVLLPKKFLAAFDHSGQCTLLGETLGPGWGLDYDDWDYRRKSSVCNASQLEEEEEGVVRFLRYAESTLRLKKKVSVEIPLAIP